MIAGECRRFQLGHFGAGVAKHTHAEFEVGDADLGLGLGVLEPPSICLEDLSLFRELSI